VVNLSQEEVRQWQAQAVTAEIFRRIEQEYRECVELLSVGATMRDNPLLSVQETADAVGFLRGLKWILDFKGDEET